MDQFKSYERRLNVELSKFAPLNEFERRTQLPKTYFVGGFAAFYLLLVYLNIGGIGQFFANLASVVLPGYYSLVALETPSKSDDTQFLTYWVVYSAFTIIESWSGIILYWVPAYWLIKTLLFIWLGVPAFSGARYVYTSIVQPVSRKFLGIRPSPVAAAQPEVKSAFTSTAAH